MAKRETSGPTRVPPRFEETVKRLIVDLEWAEGYLVFAALPQSTLEGLSRAVDKARATVWAVLNSVVDEFSDSQRATIILTSHRIQRAQTLLSALNDELDGGNINRDTKGVEELRGTLGLVYKKLHHLATGKPAPPPEVA